MSVDTWVVALLFLTGAGLFFFAIYRPIQRWKKSQVKSGLGPRVSELDRIQADDIQRNLNDLYIKLIDVSREIQATLDSKIHLLHALLKEADETIQALKRATGEGGEKSRSPEVGKSKSPEAESLPPNPQPLTPNTNQQPTPTPEAENREQGSPSATLGYINPLKQKVYALHDQRVPPEDISRKLDLTLEQIQLIMNLRRYES